MDRYSPTFPIRLCAYRICNPIPITVHPVRLQIARAICTRKPLTGRDVHSDIHYPRSSGGYLQVRMAIVRSLQHVIDCTFMHVVPTYICMYRRLYLFASPIPSLHILPVHSYNSLNKRVKHDLSRIAERSLNVVSG